jgi:hypothetical protein
MSAYGKFFRLYGDTVLAFCPGCKTAHPIDLNRWEFNGDLESPSFSPSLLCGAYVDEAHRCHSFIRDGQWQFLSDCWHDLRDQFAPMVEINEEWNEAR